MKKYFSTVLDGLSVDVESVGIGFDDVQKSVDQSRDVNSLFRTLLNGFIGENRLQIERQTTGSTGQTEFILVQGILFDHGDAVVDPFDRQMAQLRTRRFPQLMTDLHESRVGKFVGATMSRLQQLFHEISTEKINLIEMEITKSVAIENERNGDLSQATEEKGNLFDRSPTTDQQHL